MRKKVYLKVKNNVLHNFFKNVLFMNDRKEGVHQNLKINQVLNWMCARLASQSYMKRTFFHCFGKKLFFTTCFLDSFLKKSTFSKNIFSIMFSSFKVDIIHPNSRFTDFSFFFFTRLPPISTRSGRILIYDPKRPRYTIFADFSHLHFRFPHRSGNLI